MFQKMTNEKIELLQRENENTIQKLISIHNEKLLSLTSEHEQQIRKIMEERQVLNRLLKFTNRKWKWHMKRS